MAGRIPDAFLQQLRDALPVSEVVRRRIPALKREGHEWKCLSPFKQEKTPSFSVNDDKGLWYDFSAGFGGNIIDFEMKMTGGTFVEAVRDLAAIAGMTVPGDSAPAARPVARARPDIEPPPDEPDDPGPMPGAPGAPQVSSRRQTTKTYDYTDADGGLIYQVCRQEWVDKGERKKTFLQRRPTWGDDRGHWIWGLDADTYVQARDGDFYRLTKPRQEWPGKRIEVADAVPHSLFNMAALAEEMAQDADDRRVVFSPEGEKDCDTLAAWGLLATDSSGGSKNWSPHHAEMLRDADVVVLMDNDRSGREYGHRKAASLRGIAKRVRVVDWAATAAWSNPPAGADVTDWRDYAGGSAAKLWALVDKLPDWTPEAPESAFGAVRFVGLDTPARELEWLIKGVLTRGEVSIWYGLPGCGKSFLATDAGLAIARGLSWLGQRTRPGLVIYQAGEGGLGLKKRLRAYRLHHKVRADLDVPFVLLPSPINLFVSDADVDKLIEEIKAWAAFYDAPLELVVIDTFSAATPGADENAGKDVGPVLARCRRIANETGAHVALVHHTPKGGGSPRGWSGFLGNVDNAVEVVRTEDKVGTLDVRHMTVTKQKDDQDGLFRRFILPQVVLSIDADGDRVTSCVVSALDAQAFDKPTAASAYEIPHGWADLKPNNRMIMRALVKALADSGRIVPIPDVHVAAQVGERVCTVGDWVAALCEIRFSNDRDDPPVAGFPWGKRLHNACKRAIDRTYSEYDWSGRQNLITKDRHFVWRTGRKVVGLDTPPPTVAQAPNPAMILAPGEDPADVTDLLTRG
jgi:AAA domain-containing protein/CHC2-type zinc finger protein